MTEERLQKYLSRCGVAARRKAEVLIREGRVRVNTRTVTDPRWRVTPGIDVVTLNGKSVRPPPSATYIALNKPAGYISDLADPRGRKLARDLIISALRLVPVGRLDYASEGLLLFTDDGDFAHKVMHPRYRIEREYLVKLRGTLTAAEMARLTAGITIQGRLYRAKKVVPLKPSLHNYWYAITLAEGRNRMVRLMADALGHPVLRLRRVRIGQVRLGSLKPGTYRFLTAKEVRSLVAERAVAQ